MVSTSLFDPRTEINGLYCQNTPRNSPFKDILDFGARYGPLLALFGSTIAAAAYASSVVTATRKDTEALEKVMTEKDKVVEEKLKTFAKEKEALEKVMTEKDKVFEEKLKTVKAEAAKEAINDYLKYNHSEEYKSFRKATEMADSKQ